LPLAHVFEQLVQNALWMEGAQIAFYQGDTLKILEDIKTLRPTLFPSVPRLFNRYVITRMLYVSTVMLNADVYAVFMIKS
jgi:long-subunit acyl-CoA synthetase (AMP-forming)